MARSVDSDKLWDAVIDAVEETASADYGLSYMAQTKWTSRPWELQSGRPLGGFFRNLEPRLAKRVKALDKFRIPKGAKVVDKLVKQAMNQSVHYVYGEAVSFLAENEDAKIL